MFGVHLETSEASPTSELVAMDRYCKYFVVTTAGFQTST